MIISNPVHLLADGKLLLYLRNNNHLIPIHDINVSVFMLDPELCSDAGNVMIACHNNCTKHSFPYIHQSVDWSQLS